MKKFSDSAKISQGLVAFDLSHSDYEILNYLKFFSNLIPTEALHFIHVSPEFDFLRSNYFPDENRVFTAWKLNEDIWKKVKTEVDTVFTASDKFKITFDAPNGNPLQTILKSQQETEADLLIVGKKEERSSTLARNLVRKTNGAILVIPDGVNKRLEKILVPIDFSDNAARALKTAIAMGNNMPNPPMIVCLNIYALPDFSSYSIGRPEKEFKSLMRANVEEAMTRFLAKNASESKTPVTSKLVERKGPRLHKYILEKANELQADMIVMGAKGHSLVDRFFIGSVTEKLLTHNDKVPTLVIK